MQRSLQPAFNGWTASRRRLRSPICFNTDVEDTGGTVFGEGRRYGKRSRKRFDTVGATTQSNF
jgi:hypothetical protein